MKLFGYRLRAAVNPHPTMALSIEFRRVEAYAEPVIFQFRIYRKAVGYPARKPIYWRWKPVIMGGYK